MKIPLLISTPPEEPQRATLAPIKIQHCEPRKLRTHRDNLNKKYRTVVSQTDLAMSVRNYSRFGGCPTNRSVFVVQDVNKIVNSLHELSVNVRISKLCERATLMSEASELNKISRELHGALTEHNSRLRNTGIQSGSEAT